MVIEDVRDAGDMIMLRARIRPGSAASPGRGSETGVHGRGRRRTFPMAGAVSWRG